MSTSTGKKRDDDSDLSLALALQSEEYSHHTSRPSLSTLPHPHPPSLPPSLPRSIQPPSRSTSQWSGELNTAEAELLDPTPDIRSLFLDFNARFFSGKLSSCEVKWSKRMTLCAGVCSFDGGLCSIRLSAPLLSLRPRSDLVNTLCHEMIHGWDFLVTGERSRDGHGPSFLRKAKEINDSAGTQITVYHSFNDEVDVYRTHVWKCTGPCASRAPYFGIVKRSTNRAPQKADYWFSQHAVDCGGTFIKISSPESSSSSSSSLSLTLTEGASKKRKRKGEESDSIDKNKQTLEAFWKSTKPKLQIGSESLSLSSSSSSSSSYPQEEKVIDLKKEEKKRETNTISHKKRETITINLIEDDDDDDNVVEEVVAEEEDDDDDESVVMISIDD